MTTFHVSKFGGTSASTLGYSINKQFTPELDIRTVGYWDATRADKQTVTTGTGGIPKLTKLDAVVGSPLTAISTTGAPASQNASGERGIVWRSDSINQGVQALLFQAGILPNAKEVLIGMVLSQQAVSATSRLLQMSSDGTDSGSTILMVFSQFSAPSNYALQVQGVGTSNPLFPNLPVDNALHCFVMHYKSDGTVVTRLDGVQVGSATANTIKALLPLGGSGSLGGGFNGVTNGIDRNSNTRITHLAIAELGAIPSKSNGSLTDVERDRNAAEYWEASLMYAAGIQSKLPNGHTFKNTKPVTTWIGERT